MTATNNLAITHISQSQSQKEVTANAAFDTIDAILNTGVVDKDLSTPPGSPAEGSVYIVATSPTGAWTGKAKNIAYYLNAAWYFIVPNEGMTLWVNDEDILYSYNGTAWVTTGGIIQNASLIGINTTADSTNKLAVKSAAVLFDNNGNSSQVKVNKASAGDTASFLYQDNYSGRAEIGLIGDDNFTFKVSPDGSTFTSAMTFDKTTAAATVGTFLGFSSTTALTIASGVVTATQTNHAIDTEAAASTDDLDTISGGVADQILIIRAANDARTIVVKHGTGNIFLNGAANFSLDDSKDRLLLQKMGSNWVQIGASNNA